MFENNNTMNNNEEMDVDSNKRPGSFCLFLGDLSYFCTEHDLQKAFGPFGAIVDIRIIRNKSTKKSLSYGFVEYNNASSAGAAMREMNGKIVCGRAIRIRWASTVATKEGERSMNTESGRYCLYVGDISFDLTENMLQHIFGKFGEILSVKLLTKHTEKGLNNYCFIEFAQGSSAMDAMKELDGDLQYGVEGKPIRVRWASNSSSNQKTEKKPEKKPSVNQDSQDDNNRSVSIFVSFNSVRQDVVITDEFLRNVFGRYGKIMDVAIRLSLRDKDSGLQRGYAFICYADNNAGVDAAMRVTREMTNVEFEGVFYKCEPSRRLLEKLGQQPTDKRSSHMENHSNAQMPPGMQRGPPQTHPHPNQMNQMAHMHAANPPPPPPQHQFGPPFSPYPSMMPPHMEHFVSNIPTWPPSPVWPAAPQPMPDMHGSVGVGMHHHPPPGPPAPQFQHSPPMNYTGQPHPMQFRNDGYYNPQLPNYRS